MDERDVETPGPLPAIFARSSRPNLGETRRLTLELDIYITRSSVYFDLTGTFTILTSFPFPEAPLLVPSTPIHRGVL